MPEKYDTIGKDYNLTRQADNYITERLYYHLNPETGKIYLDIGCGTGNYTHALNKKGVQFIGIDPSEKMLDKAKLQNQNITWLLGKAESIPLDNESIDGCIASLTLHHWTNLSNGFKELYRVLKTNGKVVIFTSTPNQMKGYWLNHYFPKMLSVSIQQMPSFEIIKKALIENRFKNIKTEAYFIKPDLQDLFLYAGKERPELYLNAQVRYGISSFSALSNKKEVEQGLHEIEDDIKTKKITKIINDYKNDYGDYLFIITEKQSLL
jgi:ubiquinone/menaquinone biosynthesis C-methylase UbiE